MDTQNQSPVRSILQFAIVGLVLVVLLVGVVYGITQFASSRDQTPQNKPGNTAQEESQKATEDKKAEEKKQQDAKIAEEEKKKQQEQEAAKKAEEDKKKQEQAAAQATAQAAQTPPAQQPSQVATSGPEDTLFSLVGITLLGYASYSFWLSRRQRKN